jgi:hypothetical protein
LSTLVLIPLRIPCLDYQNNTEDTSEGDEIAEDVYYEEPDLSGGVEGVDYLIECGTEEDNEEA